MAFPENVVNYTTINAFNLNSVAGVLRRPLRVTDPSNYVGVYANTWAPEDHVTGQHTPSMETWLCSIQSFVQDMDEERGIEDHTALARDIRHMLYRDQAFGVGLTQLQSTFGGFTDKLTRWGVRQQSYIANEVDNAYLYMSITEFWFDTSSTPE